SGEQQRLTDARIGHGGERPATVRRAGTGGGEQEVGEQCGRSIKDVRDGGGVQPTQMPGERVQQRLQWQAAPKLKTGGAQRDRAFGQGMDELVEKPGDRKSV